MTSPKLTASSPEARAYLPLICGRDGALRASKPKNGNAAYIWRMVGFYVSRDPKMRCMPTTADFGVAVPGEWLPEAPEEWLSGEVARERSEYDDAYVRRESPDGTPETYFRRRWVRSERRHQFICRVLDPICREIERSVPIRQQPGTMAWGRAFGLLR